MRTIYKGMFKITRGAITITCETPEELQDAVDALRRGVGERPTVAEVVARSLGGIPDKNPWTPRVLSDFVQAVGGEFVGIRHRSIFGSREPGVPREVVAMA